MGVDRWRRGRCAPDFDARVQSNRRGGTTAVAFKTDDA